MTAKEEIVALLADETNDAIDISPERLGELFDAASEVPEQLTKLVGTTTRQVVARADMEALVNAVA